jgi:drug/metabolite transporter (DMT)-like permease
VNTTPVNLQPGRADHRPATVTLVSIMMLLQTMGAVCYPIAKYGLSIIEPFTFAFYRFLISALVLLAIVHSRKRRPKVERSDWWRIGALGVIIVPFNQVLFLVGQSLTGAGHGAFLFSTTPVWVFVLAILHLKEKATWNRTIGIIMATAGVMMIMWSGLASFGTEYLLGDLIIVVAVVAWGYYTVLGKKLVRKYGALRTTAYALAIGSALYTPFGLVQALKYDYSGVTLGAWGSVAYMALGMSVTFYVVWYWFLKFFDASRIAVYHNVQPVIASLIAYYFLGEPLSALFLTGGAIIISGVVITEVHLPVRRTPG